MQLDFGINTGFVEELYAQYLENPESVDPSWRAFFATQNGSVVAAPPALRALTGAARRQVGAPPPSATPPASGAAPLTEHEREVLLQAARQARVYQLVNTYRVRG